MGWGGEKEQEMEKKPSEKWVKPNDTMPQKRKQEGRATWSSNRRIM